MRSKAVIIAATAFALLISGSFGQAQSAGFTSTSSGTGSSSQSSSSSATGTSTSPQQGATTQPQQQQQPAAVTLPIDYRQVQPFSAVALCAPINLRILPNTTSTTPENAYAFTVSAEADILSKIQAQVGPDGILSITASGPFTTNQTVQLTASLPPDALNAIVHSGPSKFLKRLKTIKTSCCYLSAVV
jgi:hypothetical protein